MPSSIIIALGAFGGCLNGEEPGVGAAGGVKGFTMREDAVSAWSDILCVAFDKAMSEVSFSF